MRMSRGIFFLLALPVALAAATPETRELIDSGNSFYRMGLYEEAGRQYLRAAKLDGDSPEINYNLGNVYHQKFLEAKLSPPSGENRNHASEWEQKAVTSYLQALASESPTLRARVLFNLGNTYAEAQRRDEAITAYQEALRILPGDEDTKHNLELLLRTKKVSTVVEVSSTISNGVEVTSLPLKHGRKTTNSIGKAQAMGGVGGKAEGQGEQKTDGLGGGAGAVALGGGGGAGKAALAGGAGAGTVASGVVATNASASDGGEKGNRAGVAESSAGGTVSQNTAGAGGPAGSVEGRTGTTSADKVNTKDKTASSAAISAQSDTTTLKDQDKNASASSAATDTLDPKHQEVLDKASKAEQRYINQWTRPPELKKSKDQDW